MYAQVFEGVGVGRSEDLSQAICRDLIPALRAERGFSGAVSLVDRDAESTLLLVFWETEEEAAGPLPAYFAAFLARLGVADAADCAPRVWEVGARA